MCPLMVDDDFKTIEHDFLHIKDHFNNCKFNYKERLSKYDFLQNIECSSIPEVDMLVEEAKKSLVEVKNVYNELDKEIRSYSQELYSYETKINDILRYKEELEVEEKEAIERYEKIKKLEENFQINYDLNKELDNIEKEIKEINLKIDKTREEMGYIDISSVKKEEEELRMIKQDLAAKQKRLTIVNTDSYIEDIYYWYEQINRIFQMIFGKISLEMNENRLICKMENDEMYLELIWKDNKLWDANLYGSIKDEVFNGFNEIKNKCISNNNILLLVETVFLRETEN